MTAPTPNMIELLASAENALLSSQSLEAGLADKKSAVLELEAALAAARKDLDAASAEASDAGKAFKDTVASIVALRPELTAESVEGMISTRLALLGGVVAPVAPVASKEKASKKPEGTAEVVEPAKPEPEAPKPADAVVTAPVEQPKPADKPKADPAPEVVEPKPDSPPASEEADAGSDAGTSEDDAVEDDDQAEEEVAFDPMALAEEEPTEVWGEDEQGEDAAAPTEVVAPEPEIVEEKASAGKTPGSRSNRPAPAAAKPVEASPKAADPVEPTQSAGTEAPTKEKEPVVEEVVVESISNSDLPDFLAEA